MRAHPFRARWNPNARLWHATQTMFGLDFQYDFSKQLQVGGTLMHLGEQPLTSKVAMGSEPLNNTIWGLNMAWKTQSQWLTNLVNRLPFVHSTAPSNINFTAEFAQLIAGRNTGAQGNASYLDDFENAKTDIDISMPQQWTIASTPSMFAESQLTNNVRYGYNRALLAWYVIDPLFTRRSSSLTPGYIKNDLQQLSDPRVREIYASDLYPNKSLNYKDAATLPVLNLAFYPNERGPYNLDPSLDSDGRLLNPAQRWGGMMRRLETSDFDAANVEYVEFWMMDPFTEINGKSADLQRRSLLQFGRNIGRRAQRRPQVLRKWTSDRRRPLAGGGNGVGFGADAERRDLCLQHVERCTPPTRRGLQRFDLGRGAHFRRLCRLSQDDSCDGTAGSLRFNCTKPLSRPILLFPRQALGRPSRFDPRTLQIYQQPER